MVVVSDMVVSGDNVDLPMVADRLKNGGAFEEIGGVTYLMKITDEPMAVDFQSYCRKVKEYASLRTMIEKCYTSASLCMAAQGDIAGIIDSCQREVNSVEPGTAEHHSTPFSELSHIALDQIDTIHKNKGQITGLSTGLTHLDEFLCGMQSGDLIVLAARPGAGKSALALDIAIAASAYVPVEIYSLEMPKLQLTMRAISSQSMVNGYKFRSGGFTDEDMHRINNAAEKVSRMPVSINDKNVSHLEINRLMRRSKAGLCVVDYLQLMEGNSGKNREREVAEISRSLKMLAKELNIPIIALSQLNRGLESRHDKRPMLSDLRESGAVEQDADVVMFIYREEMYCKKDEIEKFKGKAELIIRKNRSGPIGTIPLTWIAENTTFKNYIDSHDGYGV